MRWTWPSALGDLLGARKRWLGPWLLAAAGLVMACGGAQHAEARASASPATLLGGQRGYLVVFRRAARWAEDAPLPEAPREGHSRYLLSLYRAGALKFAGRFGDGSGGAMFFTAQDDAAALSLVLADPAVASDVFDFDLRPWLLADWAERDHSWPK
jgi:uncharacterized protein YciI